MKEIILTNTRKNSQGRDVVSTLTYNPTNTSKPFGVKKTQGSLLLSFKTREAAEKVFSELV